jgi:hypothetical protein
MRLVFVGDNKLAVETGNDEKQGGADDRERLHDNLFVGVKRL